MAEQSPQALRIFLSHSKKDDDFGVKLVEDLRRALGDEAAVWYDSLGGLHGGDTWWRTIIEELQTRHIFIVVLSPNSMQSPWVNDEIDLAWRLKNSPARMRIIPMLYQPCEVRPDLADLQIISFLPPQSYESAFKALLITLGLPADVEIGRTTNESDAPDRLATKQGKSERNAPTVSQTTPKIQSESSNGELQRSAEVREAQKGSDIRATLRISPAEAQRGTDRMVTLPGGRQVTVTVPANAYNEQILNFQGLGEPSTSGGPAGNLILTLSIEQQEYTPPTPPRSQPRVDVPSHVAPQPKADIPLVNVAAIDDQGGKKGNKRVIAITSGIVLGVLVLGLVFYAVSRSGSNAGNGTVTVDATATIIAQNPDPYPPMNRTLAFFDPLSDNSHGYNWPLEDDRYGTCEFTEGAYHVIATLGGGTKTCTLSNPNFSDFAYQVQMKIVKGDEGGIFFRTDNTHGSGYLFGIGQNGDYILWIFNNCTYNPDKCFSGPRSGHTSTVINTGLYQSNQVAVVAKGSTINLYVNHQKIDGVSLSTFSQGQIGVFASDVNGPTEVVFSYAKVWT